MTGIAETYVVVSLLMAVFAAVAAVGTSLVLGVGFERLRNGFEIVRKQTAFFSDAIHKLDEKTIALDQTTQDLSRKTEVLEHKTECLEIHQNELAREALKHPENHISADKTETLVRRAENLLTQVNSIARNAQERFDTIPTEQSENAQPFSVPPSLAQHMVLGGDKDSDLIRFH